MRNNIVIRDNDDEKIMLGAEWNNGDWNLRLATKITYLAEHLSEEELKEQGKYLVEVIAVSPDACGEDKVKEAIDDMGLKQEIIDRIPLIKYEVLIERGTFVPLWGEQGNNLKKLISQANKELQLIHVLFGFYMDRYVNRIGDTGWDWIAGDVGASMRRYRESLEEGDM